MLFGLSFFHDRNQDLTKTKSDHNPRSAANPLFTNGSKARANKQTRHACFDQVKTIVVPCTKNIFEKYGPVHIDPVGSKIMIIYYL